jgi:hypothetical protein
MIRAKDFGVMARRRIKKDFRKLTFAYPVPKGRQRLRELIIYIAERYKDAPLFGAIKLNKTLYHSDFRAYERFGIPLTGTPYFALRQGPAPKAMVPILNSLLEEGAIKIEKRQVGNREQKRVVPRRKAFLELFTGDELALVDEVIKELWDQSADDVSNASHDVRWRTVKLKDLIPYEAAFLSQDPLTENDLSRTAALANEHGWK